MKHILTLCAALFVLGFTFETRTNAEKPAENLAVQSVSGLEETGWRSFWKPRFEEKFKQAEAGDIDIVFLGDSITNFWETNGKTVYAQHFADRKILNLGFSGDRTQHTVWLVQDSGILEKISPKLFILMIGTNNVGWNETSPAQTLEGIQKILKIVREKKPEAKIVLFDVFPRGENNSDGMRKLVNEINDGIQTLTDGENIFYASINSQLLEADGETLTRETMPDLLHPGAKGYEFWAEAIEPYITKYVR